MRALGRSAHSSIATMVGYAIQRGIALFLFVVTLAGILVPPVSVYAATASNASDPTAIDTKSPPALHESQANNTPSADYAQSINGGLMPGVAGQSGDPLSGVSPQHAVVTPHELVEKRTATSDVTINADGSYSQRNYWAPKYYQSNGAWQPIDPTLIEDTNADDSDNLLGQALNLIGSAFTSPTTFTVKANNWQARFAPSDFAKGMVRIAQSGQQIGFAPLHANAVNPVITTDSNGQQTVHYYDLWPNIDVEYQVNSYQVKEFIVLKSNAAQNQVQFMLLGTDLTQHDVDGQTAYDINDALNGQFAISPLNLTLNSFGPETNQAASGLSQFYVGEILTVSLDAAYLKNLPSKAFPAVIDPTVNQKGTIGTRSSGNYVSMKSDGYVCPSTVCNPQAGSLQDSNYVWRSWRGAFYTAYNFLSGKVLMSVNLHITRRTGVTFYTGDSTARTFKFWHASCNNNYNCADSALPTVSSTFGDSANVNVTTIYQALISHGNWGGWIFVTGQETTANTYKNFDPDPGSTYFQFTYNSIPSTPVVASPSANNQVFVDPQVSFRVNPSTDGDGDPLQYYFRIATNSDGETGSVINSGNLPYNQWTVPDGVLQDGTTYYLHTYAYDGYNYSTPSPVRPFRIDMRRGKDKTQTYDTLGPVNVDLATGNVTTSATSHTSKALGGDLGVSMTYNSPVQSRNGLIGEYYNNNTFSGSPVLTRVDQNIDFNWDTGAPSPVVPADNFSSRWTGYFVAPKAGSYQFASDSDDGCHVWINSQLIIDSWAWHNCAGQYAAAMTFTAGQVVPIKVEQHDTGGGAAAHLYVKGVVSSAGEIVPSDMLQTGVRPIATPHGLVGHYYRYTWNGTPPTIPNDESTVFLTRTDPILSFNWGNGSPVSGGPVDGYMARWYGYFTAPASGAYYFGRVADDGTRITVNNTLVLDNWVSGAHSTSAYGSSVTLSAGQTVPITVDYFEANAGAYMTLMVKGAVTEQVVPSDWLSPQAQVLPAGWGLGLDPDGSRSYDHITSGQSSAVLTDSTGDTHEYTATSGGGYKPPVNEDGHLVRNSDGTFTFIDVDGRTYIFNTDGTLQSVTNPIDDRHPSALQYSYGSTPNSAAPRLLKITDGVDNNRFAALFYSGASECGTIPTGFEDTPDNMLCAVQTNDGRTTYFYYQQYLDANNLPFDALGRIVQPGNVTTDYQYDQLGRIAGMRDSLANDAINAAIRAADDSTMTQITYDDLGRAISVTQPAATAGAVRRQATVEYLPGDAAGTYDGATQEHITGAVEPNGYTTRVEYDDLFRTTKDYNNLGLATVQAWDPAKDLLLSTTDPTGNMATTIYDSEDRPISSYGPAPAAWFDSNSRQPLAQYASQVPHADTAYDENITGPAVTYQLYGPASKGLTGAPFLHSTNLTSASSTQVSYSSSGSSPDSSVTSNWGVTLTGKLRLPTTGAWTFRIVSDGGVAMSIDDGQATGSSISDWTDGTSRTHPTLTYTNTTINNPLRFMIQYYHTTGNASFTLYMTPPGGTETANVASYFSPDYGLQTSTTTYDSTVGNVTATTNYGANPELGLPVSTTVDASGLNLTASSTYETPGATDSYLRQTSSSLPGGATTTYSYYGATETADNPCTPDATEAYREGGMAEQTTDPTGITSQNVYDDAGNIVATRTNNDDWTCTSYDARGRVTTVDIPSINSQLARIVTYNYAVNGNPLVVSKTDSQGTITTTVDLLGRKVGYVDVYGATTTNNYDNLGRVSSVVSLLGTETYTYNDYDQLTDQKLDGQSTAQPTYDQYGRMNKVVYPGADITESITYDTFGRTSGQSYSLANGTVVSDAVSFSQSGMILTDTSNIGSSNDTWSYTYDKASRLTSAADNTSAISYGFGTEDASCTNGTNTNAGNDSNRTSMTKNGVTTTYCYDNADRLISSSDPTVDSAQYDSHGNTTSLGTGSTTTTFTYDSSDRNTSITEGAKSTTYVRDVNNRIVSRTTSDGTNSTTTHYAFLYDSDSPDVAMDASNNITEKYLSLPGDVQLTLRPASTSASYLTASLSNIHGDTMATVDADGTLTGTYTYDPFGVLLSSSSPANTTNNASFAWEGQHQKTTETSFTLNPIQMGARVYIPSLGRFLQADPIPGGTPNDYVYPTDPVNGEDLSGQWFGWRNTWHAVAKVYHFVCGDGLWQLSCIPVGGVAGLAGKWGIRGARALWVAKVARDARIAEDAARAARVAELTRSVGAARRITGWTIHALGRSAGTGGGQVSPQAAQYIVKTGVRTLQTSNNTIDYVVKWLGKVVLNEDGKVVTVTPYSSRARYFR